MAKEFSIQVFQRHENSQGLESMESFVNTVEDKIQKNYPPKDFQIISLSFTKRHAMLSYYFLG